jgi:hypothetical protein
MSIRFAGFRFSVVIGWCIAASAVGARHLTLTPKPGVERWQVKTGIDDGNEVTREKSTTVEKLAAIHRPSPTSGLPFNPPMSGHHYTAGPYDGTRFGATERTVYTVSGRITTFRVEEDGDYHIVLAGSSGKTMVIEIPKPVPPFVKPESRWADEIASARAAFNQRFTFVPSSHFAKPVSVPVTVKGVGFFDFKHAATPRGMLPSYLELHPVLDMQFN